MKIGISTASFFSKIPTEESHKVIRDLGFSCCEVFLTTFSEYSPEFGQILAENFSGLEVYSVHSLNQHYEPELFNIMERTRNDSEVFFKQVALIAQLLHAKVYTFHGPARLKKIQYDLNYPWIAKRVNSLNTLLGELTSGVCQLAYENVHWTYFNKPDFFKNLRDYSTVCGCLDIKQAMQSKIDVYKYLKILGDRLINVHLCDYDTNGQLKIPGKGSFDFIAFFRKLYRLGYSGPLIIEVYPKDYIHFEELITSKIYLEECLNEAIMIEEREKRD